MASVLNEPGIMKAGGEPLAVDDLPPGRKPPSIPRQPLSNPLSVSGFIILAVFAFIALAAPFLAPPLPNATRSDEDSARWLRHRSSTARHPLDTQSAAAARSGGSR